MNVKHQRWNADIAAFAGACLASVIFTWPLAPNAADHLLRASYWWDAYTNVMLLGSRVDAALGRGPLSLFDEYYFAPLPRSIVFNENHFGLSLLFAPFYALGKNPLLAYNLTLLLSLSLSVFFTTLLVRRLTGNAWSGFLAGIAFTFSPYVVFELGRLQLVATQWIPACFYCLHGAVERGRARDVAAFWLVLLLQLGTCLYYAMFLLPLLATVGFGAWLWRHPPRRTAFTVVALGVAAGAVALGLFHPYFLERQHFELARSHDFAASYDGKLSFFGHVPESNLGLTWLHHPDNWNGAHEEIAFPGFTVLALALFALCDRLAHALNARGPRAVGAAVARALVVLTGAALITLWAHSTLAGAVALLAAAWLWRRRLLLDPTRGFGLYVAALGLAVVLFLGLEPFTWQGRPVHGLYYYLHTYFPGYDGIRKVSRQAVMTSFLGAVVASFGSAALLSWAQSTLGRVALFAALLGATTFELRCFPYPLAEQWAGASVPAVYRFLAGLPVRDLLAVTPQDDGKQTFRSDAGMALHNYLSLYHRHRFLDGQSSFTPPVTDLVRRALADLPSESGYTILRSLGTDHLLIHGADLPENRRNLPASLLAQPDRYRPIFRDGDDHVFTLLDHSVTPPPLAEIPPLPAGLRQLAPSELVPFAALESPRARYATDGDPDTFWSSRVRQGRGQVFEVGLTEPQRVVALEIENSGHEMFLPMSYVLQARLGNGIPRVVARQPELLLYRTQVYAPKQFVFRIVLPQPAGADRLRLIVDRPMPGLDIVIHELRVFVAP